MLTDNEAIECRRYDAPSYPFDDAISPDFDYRGFPINQSAPVESSGWPSE